MRALKRFLFPYAHVLNAEGDVLFNAFLKKLIFGVLEYHAHKLSSLHALLFIRHVEPIDVYGAAVGLKKAVKLLHKRALTAAGMAYEPQKFAILYPKAYVCKGGLCYCAALHVCIIQFFDNDRHIACAISSTLSIHFDRFAPCAFSLFASCCITGTSSLCL